MFCESEIMSLPINNLNINDHIKYRIRSQNNDNNSKNSAVKNNTVSSQHSFGAAADVLTSVFKWCDANPVGGVIAIDIVSTDIPRTYVDLKTAGPAAAVETIRREFSGTFVDCIMPGFIVLGAGKLLNSAFMKRFNTDMTSSWASSEALDKLASIYKPIATSTSTYKIHDFVKNTLNSLKGFDTDAWVDFSKKIPKNKMDKIIDKLTGVINNDKLSRKETKKALDEIYKNITNETNCSNTIKFKGDKKNYGSNLSDLLRDTVEIGRKFKNDKITSNLDDFIKKSKKMLTAKSLIGLAITLPIAMSLQAINRYLTRKKYKVEGAPIYKDFEKGNANHKKMNDKEKNIFFGEKILASVAMTALAALSLKKKPSLSMLQFNGLFPSMDQCRIISLVTFISRLFASEDKNELRESFIRDAISFASFYFLGDYVAKGTASLFEKYNKDVKLINRFAKSSKDDSIFKKFKIWASDTALKSFDEIKGKKATNLRSVAQAAGLAFSLVTLGILLPVYNRKITEKKVKSQEKVKINQENVKNT